MVSLGKKCKQRHVKIFLRVLIRAWIKGGICQQRAPTRDLRRRYWLTITELEYFLLKAFPKFTKEEELKLPLELSEEVLDFHSAGFFTNAFWILIQLPGVWVTPSMDSNKCLGWSNAIWLLWIQVSEWIEARASSRNSTCPRTRHLYWNLALLTTSYGTAGNIVRCKIYREISKKWDICMVLSWSL